MGDVVERVAELRGALSPEPAVLSCSKDHGIIPQMDLFQKRLAALDTRRYKIVHPGDFVYDPNLLWSGAIARSQEQTIGIVSPVYEVFRSVRECSQEFLYAWLTSPSRLPNYRAISMGTNVRRRRADFGDFAQLPLLFPPLPEQRAIAAVLDSIDEAIESTEAVVAATERLRDALLHELLTRGVPGWHSEWKEAPGIGMVPADWEVVRLRDVAEVNRDQWDPAEGSSILYLDLTAVAAPGRLSPPNELAAEDAPSRARRRVQAGDVLISTVRPYLRGFARLLEAPHNLIASTGFAVLTPLPKVDGSLIYHHVMAPPFVGTSKQA